MAKIPKIPLSKYIPKQPSIKTKLKSRPTAGLVNHVLGNPGYSKRHATYPGKSY